jgi:hypothetical protein
MRNILHIFFLSFEQAGKLGTICFFLLDISFSHLMWANNIFLISPPYPQAIRPPRRQLS